MTGQYCLPQSNVASIGKTSHELLPDPRLLKSKQHRDCLSCFCMLLALASVYICIPRQFRSKHKPYMFSPLTACQSDTGSSQLTLSSFLYWGVIFWHSREIDKVRIIQGNKIRVAVYYHTQIWGQSIFFLIKIARRSTQSAREPCKWLKRGKAWNCHCAIRVRGRWHVAS